MAIGITQHQRYQPPVQNQNMRDAIRNAAGTIRTQNDAIRNAAGALNTQNGVAGNAASGVDEVSRTDVPAYERARERYIQNRAERQNAFGEALRDYLQNDTVGQEFQNKYNLSVLQDAIRKMREQGMQNLPGAGQTVPAGQLNKLPGAGYTGGASTLPMRPDYQPGQMENLRGGIYNPPRKFY